MSRSGLTKYRRGVDIAVGAAFVAAMIALAHEARADIDIDHDPFQDLFGDTGFNSWTPAADSYLNSIDPTLAENLDPTHVVGPPLPGSLGSGPSVDWFLQTLNTDNDPFSTLVYGLEVNQGLVPMDQVAFSYDPTSLFYLGYGGVPLNGLGDFALGLDYTIFASGLAPTLDPVIYGYLVDPILYPGGFFPLFFD
jgi:hypothetical protein